ASRADRLDPDVGVPEGQLDHLADRQAVVGEQERARHGHSAYRPGSSDRGLTFCFTHSITCSVFAPGVKISRTPARLNPAMSSSGTIPPPNTAMSAAPRSRSSSMTRGNR